MPVFLLFKNSFFAIMCFERIDTMKKILLTFLTLVISISLVACQDSGTVFELVGKENVNYTINDEYSESGYIAKVDKKDVSGYVTVTNNIDETTDGDYVVTYKLKYNDIEEEITRNVYYRPEGCSVYGDSGITQCYTQWTDYLDTLVKITVYYENNEYLNHDTYTQNVELLLDTYHKLSDKYNNYNGVINVKTINDNPTLLHQVDSKLFDLIKYTLDHQDDVDNLFNIALGPVLSIWHDYREDCDDNSCSIPTMNELLAANQFTDPSKVILNEENSTVTMDANMSLDLGGVSKGYISEILCNYLDSLNIHGYLLNNGQSNISIGGDHPTRDEGKFIIGVTDPFSQTRCYEDPFDQFCSVYSTVMIGDEDQLVTSGDYQKYFYSDGEIYHHIINPISLMPDHYSRSVTVISNGLHSGLLDMYSTAIFTMPIDEGIEFVNNIDGLEAIWYGIDSSIHYSANFEELYNPILYMD